MVGNLSARNGRSSKQSFLFVYLPVYLPARVKRAGGERGKYKWVLRFRIKRKEPKTTQLVSNNQPKSKMDSNVVSSLVWVKKGFAKANPKEFEIDEEDINQMRNEPLVKKK